MVHLMLSSIYLIILFYMQYQVVNICIQSLSKETTSGHAYKLLLFSLSKVFCPGTGAGWPLHFIPVRKQDWDGIGL